VDDELAALKKSPGRRPLGLAPALRRHPHPVLEPVKVAEVEMPNLEELKALRSTSSEPGRIL